MRRHSILTAGGVLLAAIIICIISLVAPAEAGYRSTAATPPAADDSLLRELAERLLTQSGGRPGLPIPTAQLLPGALPDDLPLALPAAPGSRLIGSVARRADGKLFTADIVYDAPGTIVQIGAFYENALGQQGWAPAPIGGGGPTFGFQSSNNADFRYFCAPQQATGYLNIQTIPRANGPIDLRLRLDLTNPGPCSQPSGAPPRPPGSERLPALTAPPGVQVSPSGGGGGGNRFTSSAYAVAELSIAELHAFYAQQLSAAGWTRVTGGADGPLAWSTWQIPGTGDFTGFLYILQGSGENQSELYVQASGPYPFGPGGGPAPMPSAPAAPPATPTPAGQPPVPTRTTLVPTTP